MNWEGAGTEPGVQVWRVENKRTEDGNPDFGIAPWEGAAGEFYSGDSYIVLETQQDGEGALYWDVYFWIGAESSQDEYGVAAYKANELDDLLGDAPIQHRETEGYESEAFFECFPDGVRYLKGGIASGFRDVDADEGAIAEAPSRLFIVRKTATGKIRSRLVPLSCESLNQGDAFVLDAVDKIYSWYGESCSPFEKMKAVTVANNLAKARHNIEVVEGVDEECEEFWEKLGGMGDIAAAEDVTDECVPEEQPPQMYLLTDQDSQLKVELMESSSPDNLNPEGVAVISIGPQVFVWIGSASSATVQSQSMWIVQNHLKAAGHDRDTQIVRVKEGQEDRCRTWDKAFA